MTMVFYKLTAVELDAVCGGRKKGGGNQQPESSVEVDVTVVRVNQHQRTRVKLSMQKRVDTGRTQIISIGSIGGGNGDID